MDLFISDTVKKWYDSQEIVQEDRYTPSPAPQKHCPHPCRDGPEGVSPPPEASDGEYLPSGRPVLLGCHQQPPLRNTRARQRQCVSTNTKVLSKLTYPVHTTEHRCSGGCSGLCWLCVSVMLSFLCWKIKKQGHKVFLYSSISEGTG